MKLGYARASNPEQDLQAQRLALQAAGCAQVLEEVGSGGRWDRPELNRLLDRLRPGDTLVVCKLDRLSRSLADLLVLLGRVERAGAMFRSVAESVDTATPAGRQLMQMFGAFADFERSALRQRTLAGLQTARARGRVGGRPRALSAAKEREVLTVLASGGTAADAARAVGVSRSTVSRLEARIRRANLDEIGQR